MGVYNILEIAQSGITAHQDALQTTSHNIANVNTPHYSRQRPQLQSRASEINFGYQLGTGGVELNQTLRIHDQFVQRQILEEAKGFGETRARAETLTRMEGITHQGLVDLGDRLNDFFNGFRELSVNPELPSLRVAARETTRTMADGFHELADSLELMRGELDMRIQSSLEEVNAYATELAQLNSSIATTPPTRNPPHELFDRRDQVLRQLAEKIGSQITTDERDQVTVMVPGVGVLVQGGEANSLTALRTPASETKPAGATDIFLQTPSGLQEAIRAIPEGELGGLVRVRDETISRALNQLDRVAYELTNAVNGAHAEGSPVNGRYEGEGDFFTRQEMADGAARRLKLSDSVEADPQNIFVGRDSGAPSDNRIALAIAELQSTLIVPSGNRDGESTTSDTANAAINNLVAEIGSETKGSKRNFEHQAAIIDQLDNYSRSVSGVSLEEEAIRMMQFQTAFNAAAKTMQVGDELLETILSLKS